MTVRTSMSDLIATLRGFTSAGTADFSDAQMQTILDRYKTDLNNVQIYPDPQYNSSGVVEYKVYTTPAKFLESTDGGTARFLVTDGLGSALGTSLWSADYENGIVTFVSDQGGLNRCIMGHSFDVYAAAADIWSQKAAAYATLIDFSTDNHSVKRSHIIKACQDMADKYQKMATSGGSSSVDAVRGDSNPSSGSEHGGRDD